MTWYDFAVESTLGNSHYKPRLIRRHYVFSDVPRQLHLRNNRVRKLVRRRGAADVAGANFAFFENIQHRGFDFVGRGAFLDVA
jgi:hypothetical protein